MWENPIEIGGKTVRRFERVGDNTAEADADELSEALRSINSTCAKCEKAIHKLREGTSQHTLTERRIKALRIAAGLMGEA
jgi:hypothetical protein